MAEVTKSPNTCVDDATVGTVAWTNPNNAKVSDGVYATAGLGADTNIYDNAVRIVRSDGTIGTTDRSSATKWVYGPDVSLSHGSSSDLWGETLTAENINDNDFGVALSAKNITTGEVTHYLKATNFGFSIPAGATIDGIIVDVENRLWPISTTYYAYVDHIRITVYYTEATTKSPFPTFFRI